MRDYDLIVIGAGPAGEKGAAQAAYFGKRVAIVEKAAVVGGACVNTGTVPSKTLRETALHMSGFRQREVYGVDYTLQENVQMADLMHRKRTVIEREHATIEENIRRHNIARIHGAARLSSAHDVVISGPEGDSTISAEVILVASGSSPLRPDHVPFDHDKICDSDSILDIGTIPKSLAVVGAGVIGCEYASIFASLGVPVTLIDGRTALLGHIDREIAAVLLDSFRTRLGIKLFLGVPVAAIRVLDDGVLLTLDNGLDVRVEKVLYAAGRQSNTAQLGLEEVGVVTGRNGVVVVNEQYQTSVPNIYAAGDVIGFPALASTSMEQARVAMVHAFDLKYKTRVAPLLPYAIYTIPELSSVGLTEEQCREKGIDCEIGRAYYAANARGQIIGDDTGIIKLVFDARSLTLHGVHAVGESASEIVHTGLMVMQFGGTINAFIDSVFNFPSLSEAYKYAAYDGLGRVAKRRNG
ncbi:MAG: Si-specific NAD(P)(+) transhydrogenase [Thermoanaerobaculia bacterium]|nr:Si-specific NAD(P)(+) transhydrogenase [Thermoanaerobaculia bacterium]